MQGTIIIRLCLGLVAMRMVMLHMLLHMLLRMLPMRMLPTRMLQMLRCERHGAAMREA